MAPNALHCGAVTASASRHYSLTRIAQFVRGERGWTFKLTSATGKLAGASSSDMHFKIPQVESGIHSDVARFDSTGVRNRT